MSDTLSRLSKSFQPPAARIVSQVVNRDGCGNLENHLLQRD